MKKFITELFIPDASDAEFQKMIPAHRAYINELINRRVIESYSINQERTRGWIIMNGTDEEDILGYVEQFPIYRWIRVNVEELMVHDSELYRFPTLIMN